MDNHEIQETLKDASEYLSRLKNLNSELEYAEQQITTTANETENGIQMVFANLLSAVTTGLCTRRDVLINETRKIRERGLAPLIESRKVVMKNMQNTSNLINLGRDLLSSDGNGKGCCSEFTNNSSFLGSLPEVPPLKEVPYISFQYELNCEKDLISMCSDFGSVIHIAPVQICTLTEKPGAILVEWSTSDNDEHIADIQEYQLQKAFGNLNVDKHLQDNFRTCYIGSDTQCLVKDLVLNQHYTFRVCCKFEGEAEWSPWSLLQTASTTLKPFCWSDNANFMLSNENRIAVPQTNLCSILFSNKSEFSVGYSVEFTFLECDSELNDTFVGLFVSDKMQERKVTDVESVCVETNGNIYGSGCKKATQFPPVSKGSKICFTCVEKELSKLRINIDSCGKRVTYDWPVDGKPIYFGARFNSPKWKIMID